MKLAIGIDIGGTNANMALVSPAGRIVRRAQISTSEQADERSFFGALFSALSELMAGAGGNIQWAGIGVGAPSVNESEGTIENPANLPFSSRVEFVKIVKEHYQLPVFLAKDSNVSALGEMRYGAAQGMKNFVLLTLGTGLGCGIVMDGRLLRGERGHAGEAGHVCVQKDGRVCGCGRRGCLETYVSATGLKRTVFELMANTLEDSILRDISYKALNAKAISEAARQGDPLALKAFALTGEVLGQALADMAAWFEPEAFILSGGLAAAGEFLFKPGIESLEKYSLAFNKGKIRVAPSSLGENDAALLGAASLVWEMYRKDAAYPQI